MPLRPSTNGRGLTEAVARPTISMSWTSSICWPDGVSNRIDSPWPTDSPLDTRRTGYPHFWTLFS